ncbi:hypothetical protein CspHIS471_0302060 [Cutaneotrichosporon sp. HIS471]|nr:hypothetical protein CspHIS471_0302060 [Cutaneotrichosporon sp. HIS471]
MLDATAFPHILDGIIDLCDTTALISLRTATRDLHDRCNTRLFGHILLQWDKEGTELSITSPEPPYTRLPIRLAPPSLGDRLRRLKLALGADPDPTAGGAYDLAAHLPSLAPLSATHTIDVQDHSFPIPGWPHFTPAALPPLPSLERTRAAFPLLAPTTVLYLNIRAPPGERTLRGLALRNQVLARSDVDLVIHVFFDASWGQREMDLLSISHAKSVTLVLHPAGGGSAEPTQDAGRLLCPTSITRDISYTLVGLETVSPSLLGLPHMSHEQVREAVGALRGGDRVTFMALAEWSRSVDALKSEVPAHMVREVARTSVWSPVIIEKVGNVVGNWIF